MPEIPALKLSWLAARMLADLQALAGSRGETTDFTRWLDDIRAARARQTAFVKRLIGL